MWASYLSSRNHKISYLEVDMNNDGVLTPSGLVEEVENRAMEILATLDNWPLSFAVMSQLLESKYIFLTTGPAATVLIRDLNDRILLIKEVRDGGGTRCKLPGFFTRGKNLGEILPERVLWETGLKLIEFPKRIGCVTSYEIIHINVQFFTTEPGAFFGFQTEPLKGGVELLWVNWREALGYVLDGTINDGASSEHIMKQFLRMTLPHLDSVMAQIRT